MQDEEIKLQFNANLPYQKNAIDSTVTLFQGQDELSHVNIITSGQRSFDSNFNLISGVGNQLKLKSPQIRENILDIQKHNNLISKVDLTNRLDATIQMETGTGKTYVYLRTILRESLRLPLRSLLSLSYYTKTPLLELMGLSII